MGARRTSERSRNYSDFSGAKKMSERSEACRKNPALYPELYGEFVTPQEIAQEIEGEDYDEE
jgi:hypothetical protein